MNIRINVITMLGLAISSTSLAQDLTGVDYYGYYLDDWGVTLTEARVDAVKTYTNTQIIMGTGPVRANVQTLASRGMKAIPELTGVFHGVSESLWPGRLASLATDLSGLTGSIAAMYVMDEPYFNGWDQAKLQRATALVKAQFPTIPTMTALTTARIDRGVPSNMDWVGIDPYPFDRGPLVYGLFPALARSDYDNEIDQALIDLQTYMLNKPVFMIGQAFEKGGMLPEPEWQRWYWDTARENDNIIGLMWFAYERSDLTGAIGTDLIPAHQQIGAEIGIPEPTTLALLAMGGLALRRRK